MMMSKAMKKDSMKASLITLGVIVAIALLSCWGAYEYNNMMRGEWAKEDAWMSAFI